MGIRYNGESSIDFEQLKLPELLDKSADILRVIYPNIKVISDKYMVNMNRTQLNLSEVIEVDDFEVVSSYKIESYLDSGLMSAVLFKGITLLFLLDDKGDVIASYRLRMASLVDIHYVWEYITLICRDRQGKETIVTIEESTGEIMGTHLVETIYTGR